MSYFRHNLRRTAVSYDVVSSVVVLSPDHFNGVDYPNQIKNCDFKAILKCVSFNELMKNTAKMALKLLFCLLLS